jgi:hypothetical protein
MNARAPQGLHRLYIPYPRDDRLIHEHELHGALSYKSWEGLPQRVGPEPILKRVRCGCVAVERYDSPEDARIMERQAVCVVERERDLCEAGGAARPTPGHPEMQQQRSAFKAPEQTLSVPHELAWGGLRDGAQSTRGRVAAGGGTIGAGIANDPRIEDIYRDNAPPQHPTCDRASAELDFR